MPTGRRRIAEQAATLLLGPLFALSLTGCDGSGVEDPASTSGEGAGGPCRYEPSGNSAREVSAPPSEPTGITSATLVTNLGDLGLTLAAEAAPCTANSFAWLAQQGYYDDTVCHRLTVEGIFVLQCGDPTATGSGGPGYRFADELTGSETYAAGTLAMANSGVDTNGSQFFIVYADTELPASYTVFGSVDATGLQLARQVAADGVGPDGIGPALEVRIESVTTEP